MKSIDTTKIHFLGICLLFLLVSCVSRQSNRDIVDKGDLLSDKKSERISELENKAVEQQDMEEDVRIVQIEKNKLGRKTDQLFSMPSQVNKKVRPRKYASEAFRGNGFYPFNPHKPDWNTESYDPIKGNIFHDSRHEHTIYFFN